MQSFIFPVKQIQISEHLVTFLATVGKKNVQTREKNVFEKEIIN